MCISINFIGSKINDNVNFQCFPNNIFLKKKIDKISILGLKCL